jgi:CBS domain containing-hemolysin-like protein
MNQAKRTTILSKLKNRLGRPGADRRESLEGVIEDHEKQLGAKGEGEASAMMRNVLGFSDMRVDDLMVPRAAIIAVEDTSSMRSLLDQFIEANHSRLPVFRESLDDIVGMIHVKDYLRWMATKGRKKKTKTGGDPSLSLAATELNSTIKQHQSMLRDVLYVPPSMPAPDLLLKMKASHVHLAIVVDEYGGTDGLISLEDLLEEIIGDISDEHDSDAEEQAMIKKIDDVTWMVSGLAPISRLDETLGVDLLPDDQEDEADTVGGLVLELAGRVPSRGEIIPHPSGLEFEIMENDARRVKRVRVNTAALGKKPETETAEKDG